jgi:mono/diheme cytochrome c family protein
MIPPSGFLRRVILTLALMTVPLLLGLLLTYDVIKIDWTSTMEDQVIVEVQQGPRLAAPAQSVRFDGPSLPKNGKLPENPVPTDAVSLQRGAILYDINCALCHGETGQGDGPITAYWNPDMRLPADLTEARMAEQSDGALYITISMGFGSMPSLRENLNMRERWDMVNYVRGLSQ